jgi:hypothetical protein
MPSPSSGVPVRVLREAALRRVEETSLREAAAEIGLSWSGLRTFLRGTDPYSPTIQKLREWYRRTGQGRGPALEQVQAIVDSLAMHLPEYSRERASGELMDRITQWCESWCEATRAPLPDWLIELRK